MKTLRIALPIPLRQYFDYLPPAFCQLENLKSGLRVRVPFGKRELIGILICVENNSNISENKLKTAIEVIDTSSLISEEIFQLCLWAAEYYHYAIGEVLSGALPLLLRQGKPAELVKEKCWQLNTNVDVENIKRTPLQQKLLQLLAEHSEGLTAKQIHQYGFSQAILKALFKKNLVTMQTHILFAEQKTLQKSLILNAAQQDALSSIQSAINSFQVFFLNGVTGSGKTEVYLQAIPEILKQQKQILVLVPEIGLTPQTIQRFRERFNEPVVALHSGLSEKERLNAWLAAKSGDAKIVIGTRSSVFTPFANLGLIIVDEEHDLSFKQQEGFRYHARDVAIMRAHFKKIPVILGSATPSLETLLRAKQERYRHLHLPERAGIAELPQFRVIDICKLPLEDGLSTPLLQTVRQHLEEGNQVMLFLNRRGFAPVMMCHACGWIATCKRCDARMTYHQHPARLHCHHCDSRKNIFLRCEKCGDKELQIIGTGTERLENVLEKYFPDIPIARIDRDSTQRKGSMEEILKNIHEGKSRILIGTQMLAKGHHFPNVTLVAIVDADGGFFSADFRALERMGQLILQVSGRAGRHEKRGTVVIQTHHPDHPLLNLLLNENYQQFADALLNERVEARLPPFSFFALFRAEAHGAAKAMDFLQRVRELMNAISSDMKLMGPVPAPMAKRAGRYRAQLLLQAKGRQPLQNFLKKILIEIEKIPGKHKVRWSLDVDPVEMF